MIVSYFHATETVAENTKAVENKEVKIETEGPQETNRELTEENKEEPTKKSEEKTEKGKNKTELDPTKANVKIAVEKTRQKPLGALGTLTGGIYELFNPTGAHFSNKRTRAVACGGMFLMLCLLVVASLGIILRSDNYISAFNKNTCPGIKTEVLDQTAYPYQFLFKEIAKYDTQSLVVDKTQLKEGEGMSCSYFKNETNVPGGQTEFHGPKTKNLAKNN